MRVWFLVWTFGALISSPPGANLAAPAHAAGFQPVERLLDLSGLAWLGGDRFLAVHDAKSPDEDSRVRASVLVLPSSLEGLLWQPLLADFPGGPSSDLESAARIPGTDRVLVAESGDDASAFQRIFLAEVRGDRLSVTDALEWSSFTDVFNVEGTAVARAGTGYLFIWAERNSGSQSTAISWTGLTLDPFAIGTDVSSTQFALPEDLVDASGAPLYNRPVVGLEVDATGRVYVVSAFDPEGSVAQPDDGPFRSAVFEVGQVTGGTVDLDPEPSLQGTVDGLKTESVAIRARKGGIELFIGTDDENYGGTLRRLPLPDRP